jgi:glyoxylase I family protein
VIDHLDLVVTSLERSLEFYRGLLGPLGYGREGEIAGERDERVVYLNTAERIGSISLREAQSGPAAPYDRYSPGMHHVAFRCASRELVQERARWLKQRGAEISSGPREFDYYPGYFAVFFFDPDGLKLELVHRPMP